MQNVKYRDCDFVLGKSKKFDKDFEAVRAILDKGIENLTAADRVKLITIYSPSYHEGGKIEGITSYDSSATNCAFCQQCRKAAEKDASHICGSCYDYAQEHSFKGVNVLNRHSLNMLIMMAVEFTEDELSVIDCTKVNRINSSGDTPNKTYALNMLRLAKVNSHARFAYWAKNVAAVSTAVKEVGKPSNMTLIQSSCKLNKAARKAECFDFVFTVYTSKEAVKEAVKNGGGECNGKKCRECGFKCYLNGWQNGQNIAEYLRTTKEKRAVIEAAIK